MDNMKKWMEHHVAKAGKHVGTAVDATASRFSSVMSKFGVGGETEDMVSTEDKLRRQRAFEEAAAAATATNVWTGRDYTMAQVERREADAAAARAQLALSGPQAPPAPITYQQAILSQPMPVLSPLRGTSAPQGIRAISDALMGKSMTTYNPAAPTLEPPIPSTVSAGSLNAQVPVSVTSGFSTEGSAPKAKVDVQMFSNAGLKPARMHHRR